MKTSRIIYCVVVVLVLAACGERDLPDTPPPLPTSTIIELPIESPLVPIPTSSVPLQPTLVHLPTPTPEGFMRYQGETAYGFPTFEVIYDGREWILADVTLSSNFIAECKLLLVEGPRQDYYHSTVTLAGREWGIATRGPGDSDYFIYVTQYHPAAAIMGVTVPEDAPTEIQDVCRRRIETVLASFRVIGELRPMPTPSATPLSPKDYPIATPLPAGFARYQGYTTYMESIPQFEVAYDTEEWTLEEVTLLSNSVEGCKFLLVEGPRQYYYHSTVTLAGQEWDIATRGPEESDYFIYTIQHPLGVAIFGLTVPDDAPTEVKDACRGQAETVLESFRFLDE